MTDASEANDRPAKPGQPTVQDAPATELERIDLERIERDLEGVELALRRLEDGTYWTDEVTGAPIDEALLVIDPVARRNV